MKDHGTNPSVTHWAHVPGQQERLLDLVAGTINRESGHHARRYGVHADGEDIASQIRIELMQEMNAQKPTQPFDTDTPESAAEVLIDDYRIRERARTIARRIGHKASRQARLLEGVDEPTMPEDKESKLMEIARRIGEIAGKLTRVEGQIFRIEAGRQVGLDDLPVDRFNEAAQAAGVAPDVLRAHIDERDKNGSSPRERQAWSRARKKVAAVIARASLFTLLVVLMGVTSALAHQAVHQ